MGLIARQNRSFYMCYYWVTGNICGQEENITSLKRDYAKDKMYE